MTRRILMIALLLTACGPWTFVAPVRASTGEQKKDEGVERRHKAVEPYNRAVELAKKGDKKKAEEEYRKAIKADPTFADAYNSLGLLLEEGGDKAGAEAAFKSAVEKDPNSFFASLNLGRLQYDNKQLEQAEQTLSHSVSLLAPTTVAPTPDPSKSAAAESTPPPAASAADAYQYLGL